MRTVIYAGLFAAIVTVAAMLAGVNGWTVLGLYYLSAFVSLIAGILKVALSTPKNWR